MLILAFADTMATLVGKRIADEKKFKLWVRIDSASGGALRYAGIRWGRRLSISILLVLATSTTTGQAGDFQSSCHVL